MRMEKGNPKKTPDCHLRTSNLTAIFFNLAEYLNSATLHELRRYSWGSPCRFYL